MRAPAAGGCHLPTRAVVSPAAHLDRLRRLAGQLRVVLAHGSELVAVPGFDVHIWPSPDPYYRNVALPVSGAAASPAAVAAMLAVFAARARRARVEHFAELWPELALHLERAGLTMERRGPVMVRDAHVRTSSGVAPQVVPLDGTMPAATLELFLAEGAATFGDHAAGVVAEAERLGAGLRAGTTLAAVALRGGRPVAGASLIRAGDVGELLGVWCAEPWRRQRLAFACCQNVLARFGASGGQLAWLSAATAPSIALYRRLGFTPCGTQLNHALSVP